MTDEKLTAIYNQANGITGKRLPITTRRIFAAMRAAASDALERKRDELATENAALSLALETENAAATRYAQQVAHWIEKHDAAQQENAALKEQLAEVASQSLARIYTAQHRSKQLREAMEDIARMNESDWPPQESASDKERSEHWFNAFRDKQDKAKATLATHDSTAELDAVMKDAGRLKVMEHVANEWADMATNGLQWMRNIADGTSPVDRALANMEECAKHCEEVRDAAMKEQP